MRLTTYTDYALRTLIYLAAYPDQLVRIQDIADVHGIAKNHLTKVVHQLGLLGVVETVRGRHGGLRLGKPPSQINIGAVVRYTEPDFFMAECFDRSKNECVLSPSCALKGVLHAATAAYMELLDAATLETLTMKSKRRISIGAAAKSMRVQIYPSAQKK